MKAQKEKFYLFFVLCFFAISGFVFAQTADEIQAKIDEITQSKKQIEKEISGYETQLKEIGAEKNSLSKAVESLNITIKKISLDLKLTQKDIDNTSLEIQRLALNIDKNTDIIEQDLKAIAELINEQNRFSSVSLTESLLGYKTLSEFWNNQKNISEVQNKLKDVVESTKTEKKNLEDNKTKEEKKKKELLKLKAELIDKKSVLDIAQKEKTKLLAETKNKESNYQKILAEKKALSASFDKELLDFESQLKIAIDSSKIPAYGKGILSWPLDSIKITQLFGDTEFSRTGAYNGKGHNGVDFAAAIGTKIKSSLAGKVVATGNTDTVCPGASYGKWVLIEHSNGLSTLYAHLSLIKVSPGNLVSKGETIGYSGNTGFSTGPHLHFTVYATQGVQVMTKKSQVCKGSYTMPVASLEAYLDPLQYL